MNAYHEAFVVAKFQAIIASCSNSWLLVHRLFIERMGRVLKIQMMDFFFMELFFFFFLDERGIGSFNT